MAFDETLAARIRDVLSGTKGLFEKRVFGGLAFLLNGNMCCGVHGNDLIVRLDPEQTEEALRQPFYKVTNGAAGQLGIAGVAPGDGPYHGGDRQVWLVTFKDGVSRLLTSDKAVAAARAAGDVTVTRAATGLSLSDHAELGRSVRRRTSASAGSSPLPTGSAL